MKTECPSCGKRLSIDMCHIGKMVECECGHEFVCKESKEKPDRKNTFIGNSVIITDIDIPFSELVGFLIKLTLAAVPAAIFSSIIFFFIFIGFLFAARAIGY